MVCLDKLVLGMVIVFDNFTFVSSKEEVYLTFDMKRNSSYSWFVLTSTGEINEFTMLDQGITVVNHNLCNGASSIGCLIPTLPGADGKRGK